MAFLAQKLISASGGVQEETDDDFNLVTGLYHFDGSNGAQNNTFLDSSSNSFSVTRRGDATQGTFSPFSAEDGKWSIDATSGQSFVDVTNTSGDFQWGTGAFTIEGFVFMAGPNSVYGPVFIDERPASTNGAYVYLAIDSNQRLLMSVEGGTYKVQTTGDIRSDRIGKWTHFAFVRSSTSTNQSFLFWNGNKVATGTIPTNFNAATVSRLGGIKWVTASNNRQNYYSNFRFLKGTALYTGSTYTIPTEPLTNITNTKLLTLQSNRFVDNSNNSNNSFTGKGSTTAIVPFSPFAPSAAYDSAVNGGSMSSDGTGDGAGIAASSDFDVLSNGTFTIDFWFYRTDAFGTYSDYVGIFNGVSSGLLIYQYGTQFQVYINGSTIFNVTHPIRKQWVHVALTRDGTTLRLFLNGVASGTSTASLGTCNQPLSIAADGTGRVGMGGFMSDVRVVKGTAVYTSAFTPPTAPSTAITNTEALLSFTNAAIFDQTGKTNIKTGGNAQLDTTVKKFGTASYEGDGSSSSFLTLSNSQLIPKFVQSFTVECFIYINSPHKNYNNIYSGAFGLQMYVDSGGKLICWLGNSSGSYFVNGLQSTATISLSTWTHIALVRDFSAETVTWFVNGTAGGQATSVTDSVAQVGTYQTNATIGAYPNGAYLYDGFLDELRITNKARYTSNFTAPTKAFPNL